MQRAGPEPDLLHADHVGGDALERHGRGPRTCGRVSCSSSTRRRPSLSWIASPLRASATARGRMTARHQLLAVELAPQLLEPGDAGERGILGQPGAVDGADRAAPIRGRAGCPARPAPAACRSAARPGSRRPTARRPPGPRAVVAATSRMIAIGRPPPSCRSGPRPRRPARSPGAPEPANSSGCDRWAPCAAPSTTASSPWGTGRASVLGGPRRGAAPGLGAERGEHRHGDRRAASYGSGVGGRTDRISAISAGPSARRSARMRAGRRSHVSSPIMRRRNPSAASSGSGRCATWLPIDEPGHHGTHISGASKATTARTRSGRCSARARLTSPPKLWPATTAGRPASSVGEVVDLLVERPRRPGGQGPGVAPPVVAQHEARRLQHPAHPQHAAGAVHGAVHQGDERPFPDLLRPDAVVGRPAAADAHGRPPRCAPCPAVGRSSVCVPTSEGLLHTHHAEHVGGARRGVGRSRQHRDGVAVVHQAGGDRGLDHAPHHLVGRGVLVDHQAARPPTTA